MVPVIDPTMPSLNSLPKDLPLVYDTGASRGLTPFCDDFIDFVEVLIPINDIKKTYFVTDVGTTMYRLPGTDGSVQMRMHQLSPT